MKPAQGDLDKVGNEEVWRPSGGGRSHRVSLSLRPSFVSEDHSQSEEG